MNAQEEKELRIRVEQETRQAIANKMLEDRMTPEMIYKYTGIRVAEKRPTQDAYDLVARQVAAEMLMRGLPLSTIQIATRLSYEEVKELQQQYAGAFGGDEEESQPEEPPAW